MRATFKNRFLLRSFVKKVDLTPDRGVLPDDFSPKSNFFNKALLRVNFKYQDLLCLTIAYDTAVLDNIYRWNVLQTLGPAGAGGSFCC